MKTLSLIIISLWLVSCYNCAYGISSSCDEDSVSAEESREYQREYDEKLAKEKAAQEKSKVQSNHK